VSADAREPASRLGARVTALGIAQVISWGTLFYAIAVLGAAMRAEFGVSDAFLFGAYADAVAHGRARGSRTRRLRQALTRHNSGHEGRLERRRPA
jgi:hypothetical protein